MYLKFYGFNDKPFEVTPDPKFLFMTPGYQEILSALIYGIHERRGIIAVVGEVGTGKTMMLNALLDRLDRKHRSAFIFNSDLTFKQMLMMVLYDLGVVGAETRISKADAIQRLNEFAIKQLERDGNVVIIVDEAQNISDRTMENIRMLSNLETHKHKLVQIVLCGQPELDEKLSRHGWRQLVQRISLKRYSMNLSEEDTYRYLQHRLKTAGYKGPSIFSRNAQKQIWKYSEGIPRKINILCDNALLIGYGLVKKKIDEEIITEAINDLSWSPYMSFTVPEQTAPPAAESAFAAKGQNIVSSETPDLGKPAVDDFVSPGIEVATGEENASTAIETEIPAKVLERGVFDKFRLNRRQSSLVAGFLIIICLVLLAWFLIVKPKLNLGINISHKSENIVQAVQSKQPRGYSLVSRIKNSLLFRPASENYIRLEKVD